MHATSTPAHQQRSAQDGQALAPRCTPHVPDDVDDALVRLSRWIDAGNAPRGAQTLTWIRVAKITEEAGEAVAALTGATGANPRKGVTHTVDDVVGELLDVTVTSVGAIEHLTGHRGTARTRLHAKARALAAGVTGVEDVPGDPLVALSRWIDTGNVGRDPQALTWARVTTITTAAGKALGALEGVTGMNPRTGVTNSVDDVVDALLELAVASLAAIEHLTGHHGTARSRLDAKICAVAARAGV